MDLVEGALGRAHDRASEAGLDVRFVRADVTDLRSADIGSGYRLILDTGTFHGLGGGQRMAMGREVDAVAADDATVLLLAWAPKARGPMPRGVSRDEIEVAFPGWTATDTGASGFSAPKPVELLFKPGERWYRLRRGSV